MTLAPGAPTAADDVLDAVAAVAPLAAGKAANTTRTATTTLTADPDLTVLALANTVYKVRAFLVVTTGLTPDFKCDVSGPAGFTAALNCTTFDASDAAPAQGTDERMGVEGSVFAVPSAGATYATQRLQIEIVGFLVTGGTAGTSAIRWAQNTSDASNTILYAGSWFELTPMP